MKKASGDIWDKYFLASYKPYLWIGFIVFILYFQSLFFSFTEYDDVDIIVKKEHIINDFKNIPHFFSVDVFLNNQSQFYRPILLVSFAIDHFLLSNNPFIYHLTNILLHLVAFYLIFYLLIKMNVNSKIAFLLVISFAVHPLLTQAVVWIPGRNDSLLTIFIILSFIFYLNYFNSKKLISLVLYFLFFLLAIFTKETAIFLPVIIILYQLLNRSFKPITKSLILALINLILIILYFFIRANVIKVQSNYSLNWDLIINSFFGFSSYLRKIIIPISLSPIPLAESLDNIFNIILAFILILFLILSNKKDKVKFYFGILWFVIFLIPTFMNVLGYFVYFEHRIYLPMVGLIISLSQVELKINKNLYYPLIVSVFSFYFILTFNYSKYFSDSNTFWNFVIKRNPNSTIGYNNLGNIYFRSGEYILSKSYYKKSLVIDSMDANANNNYGFYLKRKNDLTNAEKHFRKALIKNPNFAEALNNLANIYISQNKLDSANNLLQRAVKINPYYYEAYNGLGIVNAKLKNRTKAFQYFSKSIEINPKFAEGFFNLSIFYLNNNEKKLGNEFYWKAINLGYNRNAQIEHILAK